MKVLFVYKPYYDNDITIKSAQEKVGGSFFSAFGTDNPEFQFEELHFGKGPNMINDPKILNQEILKKDFDICFVTEEQHFALELDTIKKLGKKLFICIWDTWVSISSDMYINFRTMMKKPRIWGEHVHPVPLSEASQYCNCLIFDYGHGELSTNTYGVSTPIDMRMFEKFDPANKDINIGFNGMMYIPERIKYFEILKNANINVTYSGSSNKNIWPAQALELKDFCSIYQRTKISLNFTENIFGPTSRARKGRIYEVAAAGSFLLTTHPEVLKFRSKTWFELGTHFDAMNESNCVEKVRYYLDNPDIREKMALSMHEHFLKTCAPKVWWEQIFEYAKN